MRALLAPLIASLSAQALAAFTALTPAVFAVVAAPDLGIAARDVGFFTTLLFLSASFSAVAGGAWVAGLGPIRVTQLCLLACAVGIALTATGSLWLAGLGGLIVGLGYGPMTPASSHMLVRVTDTRSRPFVFSLKQTSVPIGGVLAGVAIPILVASVGWRGAALAVASTSVLLMIGLQALRPGLDREATGERPGLRAGFRGAVAAIRANANLRTLGLTSFVYSAMQLCLGAYLVTYLVEDAGLSLLAAGFVLSIAQGAGIAGRLLWGALAERIVSARRLLAGLGFLMAASAVATGAIDASWPSPLVFLIAVLFGASAVGWNGLYLAEIVRVTSPEESARATGAVLFFTFSGMMVGPAVFAGLAAMSGYALAFAAIALVVLVPACVLMFPERPAR